MPRRKKQQPLVYRPDGDPHREVKDIILENLRNGMNYRDACVLAGISEVTGHRLKKLRKFEIDRFVELSSIPKATKQEELELAQLSEKAAVCESFESEVRYAIIEYKRRLINCINAGALKDWRAAEVILKVKYGDEWNPIQKVDHSGEIKAEIPGAMAMIDALQKILEETNDDIQTKQETAESDETAHIDILQEQGEETVPSN